MHKNSDEDAELALSNELYRIVNQLLHPHVKLDQTSSLLLRHKMPFDIGKPNQHDTKAEFEREFQIVQGAMEALRKLVPLFLRNEEKDEETVRTLDLLEADLDHNFMQNSPRVPINSVTNLIRSNVADVGAMSVIVLILIDFYRALRTRSDELEEQKDMFWNVPHRAPDYYARAIANRLAKLYAKETGQRPTSGSSGENGEPSTSFTRALEEIFQLLDIKSKPRSPADWAIRNLTDEDLLPEPTVGQILGLGPPPANLSLGSIFDIEQKGSRE
ncbi:hypothetical protein [Sulfitobacter mediterraneus]|uniref:Uncharacterized protein n=1 Tax=Sulfitobacter mediterraneus TaxID=83219 RepID=A0A061SIJ6_9RHOB|nr:hypothetical protein [Sulfitobacter mediterraneus]KAJ01536.1 hypothetical protein PM02_18815 [Sulfitobacter mediterraneus]